MNGVLSGKASKNPYGILENDTLIKNFINSGKTSPGIMNYSYTPIWDFIEKLYGLSLAQEFEGLPRLKKFIENLKTYYLFSSVYNKGNYVEIRNSMNNNIYQVFNKSDTSKVIGINSVWPNEVAGRSYTISDPTLGCPEKYHEAENGQKCHNDGGGGGYWGCCEGTCNCQRGFRKKTACNCVPTLGDMSRVTPQQLTFTNVPSNSLGETENIIQANINGIVGGTYNMGVRLDKPIGPITTENAINNISIDHSKNDNSRNVWKIDTKGRIQLAKTNLCIEKHQTDGTLNLNNCSEDLRQRFLFKKV